MQTKGKTVHFEGEDRNLEVKTLDRETNKKSFKKDSEEKWLEEYRRKEMKSEIYNKQDKKCNM